MLNSKREVTDRSEIIDILRRCDTIRIAFAGGEYPYAVPVSFGIAEGGGAIYFHGATRGLKAELIGSRPKICFEGDIFYKTERFSHGITARYESVIGYGAVEPVEGEEKTKGLLAICRHYGYDYDVEACGSLEKTAVYKITVSSVTGKRNLPE